MWQLIYQIIGTAPVGATIPERMFVLALAGTGIVMLITSSIRLIIDIGGKGGRF